MKYILSLLLFLGSLSLVSQTRNYDQELGDMLFDKRFEEAIEFYSQYKDSIYHPFIRDSYKLLTNTHLNNDNDFFQQLPSYIQNYHGNFIDDSFLIYYFPTIYFDRGDYVNGLRMVDILEPFLDGCNEETMRYLSSIRSRIPIYNFEVENESETDMVHIPFKQSFLFLIDAIYNETPLQTIFDTGNAYPLVTDKEHADRAGIRLVEDFAMNEINDVERSSAYGWIDSIRIGPLLIKDVPVFVFEDTYLTQFTPDSILNDKKVKTHLDSLAASAPMVLGLPIIQKLNHIQFDLSKNDMIVSLDKKYPSLEDSNMCIDAKSRKLYLDLSINDIDTVAFLDTGANLGETVVFISNKLYQNHKDKLPAVIDSDKGGGLKLNSAATVSIGGSTFDLPPETVALDNLLSRHSDIFLTLKFIEKFNKVTFDFHNMLFSGEGKE